jgi:hypothetical protein
MNQFIKEEPKCKLCSKSLWRKPTEKKGKGLVQVKTNLFSKRFNEIFHEKCWDKLKIYCG